MTQRVIIATRNRAKHEQIAQLLFDLPLELEPMPDGVELPSEATGASFVQNAEQKALATARATGARAIASDGGLEIPALGERWEPLMTRRSTGSSEQDSIATDDARIQRLLQITAHLRGPERAIRWIEAVAVADPDGLLGSWSSAGGEGKLAESPCPPGQTAGFWVDRLRYYPSLGKYHAQLSREERAAVGDPWQQLREPLRAALATPRSGGEPHT